MGRRVLVCGAGSIGMRHIANLVHLGAEVSVWRARSELLAEVRRTYPVKVCANLPNAIAEAEAVVVATATDQHTPVAVEALRAGKAVFIEKPISHSWDDVESLRALAKDRIVEVGCQFRAHPNLIALALEIGQSKQGKALTYRLAMGHRLDAWRPSQDYTQGYSANSARGGGALFDLIHQIDIALWLFGAASTVQAVLGKVRNLDINGDDIANLLLTHISGITGHIQLDMASPVYRCEAEVITANVLYRWSYPEGLLHQKSPEGEVEIDRVPEGFERNDLFLRHMTHWLKRIDNPLLPPICSLEQGVAALRVALAAREAGALQQTVHF